MANAIKFATSGGSTGLCVILAQYYEFQPPVPLDIMQEFGNFKVAGANCADAAHIVAPKHPVTNLLTDYSLSNWQCSIHELFTEYPQWSGAKNFEPIAIASDDSGAGSKEFPDGGRGTPYIIARNATTPIPKPPVCQTCSFAPGAPGQVSCDPTTACTLTPFGYMCLARGGFKADNVADDDTAVHWRMKWPGQEFRVAVAPGKSANSVCRSNLCSEILVLECTGG